MGELISKEKWTIDGNHSDTMETRFKTADLMILLDINRFICFLGVMKRNGKKRSDTTQYSQEILNMRFFRFYKGIWNFPKTRKRAIIGLHEKYPDKPFLIITSRRKMKKFLHQWRDEKTKHLNLAL